MEPIRCRELRADMQRVYELAVSATVDDAYQRLLRTASLVIDHLDPGAVYLQGITWRESEDDYVLKLHVEDVQRELSQLDMADLTDRDLTIDCTFGVPA